VSTKKKSEEDQDPSGKIKFSFKPALGVEEVTIFDPEFGSPEK
jgi:hypothetical protein